MSERTLFNLNALDEESKILFRRSVGKPLNAATPRTLHCYYTSQARLGTIADEDVHFAILCLACMYEGIHGPHCLTESILQKAIKSDGSTTLEHRVDNLMATDACRNPYLFASKLSRVLKSCDAAGEYGVPNWDALYQDMLNWNKPEQHVKRSWARAMYR